MTDLDSTLVDSFLKSVMEVESKPLYEQGSQKTARQEEIIKTLERVLEKQKKNVG